MSDKRITCPECGEEVYLDCFCSCQVASRRSILLEAMEATQGPRAAAYGPPRQNWDRTADIATAITGYQMDASTCCKVAIAMKLARLIETPKHRDSIVDLAGYAWVLSELEGV